MKFLLPLILAFSLNANAIINNPGGGSSSGGITSLGGQTGSTQTFANDTNIIITSTGGTHTLGYSGTLSTARGGNGGVISPVVGGIVYTDASKAVVLAAGTSGQVLTSAGASAPTWSAVSAASTTLNNLGTTAINTSLIFGSGVSGLLKTGNNQTNSIQITTGTNSGGNTGLTSINTGNSSNGNTSGIMFISSGDGGGGGDNSSGATTFTSGDASGNGSSGNTTIRTGVIGGAGTRGKILLVDGTEGRSTFVWTSQSTDGSGRWLAGVMAADFASTGVVIGVEDGNFINGNASLSSSVYTITITASTFASTPRCTCSIRGSGSGLCSVEPISTTSVKVYTFDVAGSASDRAFSLYCK